MLEPEPTQTEPAADEASDDGLDMPAADVAPAPDGAPAPEGDLTKEQVVEALKVVIDPELGINIVDLGLVYEVEVTDGAVDVQYTLTSMGCPIGPLIEAQMTEAAASLPGYKSLAPEMVLRPAWTPDMMSDEAKAALGFF